MAKRRKRRPDPTLRSLRRSLVAAALVLGIILIAALVLQFVV
jgi:hypothetical protein